MKTLHKTLIVSALAAATAAAALPGIASADCYRRSENGTTGAIVGALAGAAIGNSVSSYHHRGTGTAVGAVAGAAIGSSIARDNTDCYYDGYGNRDGYYREGYYRPGYRSYGYEHVYVEPRPYVRERVYVAPEYHRHYHHRHW